MIANLDRSKVSHKSIARVSSVMRAIGTPEKLLTQNKFPFMLVTSVVFFFYLWRTSISKIHWGSALMNWITVHPSHLYFRHAQSLIKMLDSTLLRDAKLEREIVYLRSEVSNDVIGMLVQWLDSMGNPRATVPSRAAIHTWRSWSRSDGTMNYCPVPLVRLVFAWYRRENRRDSLLR